jgi:hypothetical protein
MRQVLVYNSDSEEEFITMNEFYTDCTHDLPQYSGVFKKEA